MDGKSENFEPEAGSAETGAAQFPVAAMVTVHIDGGEQSFACPVGDTILEAGLAAGLDLPFSCQEGHCGACMAVLVRGTVAMAEDTVLSRRDRQSGCILACQSQPTSADIVISYDG